MTNIAIIGGGKVGSVILEALNKLNECHVLGICDVTFKSPGMRMAKMIGIPAYQQLEEILHNPKLDLVIETTGSKRVKEQVQKLKLDRVGLIDLKSNLMITCLLRVEDKGENSGSWQLGWQSLNERN